MNKLLSSFVVALLLLSGCSLFSTDPTDPAPFGATYNWGFVNISSKTMNHVTMDMIHRDQEENVASVGYMDPITPLEVGGATYNSTFTPRRVPNSIIMKWQAPNGQSCRQTISLAGLVPDTGSFEGTIWFRYENDALWHPIAISKEQLNWRMEHHMSYAPVEK